MVPLSKRSSNEKGLKTGCLHYLNIDIRQVHFVQLKVNSSKNRRHQDAELLTNLSWAIKWQIFTCQVGCLIEKGKVLEAAHLCKTPQGGARQPQSGPSTRPHPQRGSLQSKPCWGRGPARSQADAAIQLPTGICRDVQPAGLLPFPLDV